MTILLHLTERGVHLEAVPPPAIADDVSACLTFFISMHTSERTARAISRPFYFGKTHSTEHHVDAQRGISRSIWR